VLAMFVSAKAGMAATVTKPIRTLLIPFMAGAFFKVHDSVFGTGGLLSDFLTEDSWTTA
jgi:hypothetical protein